MKSLLLELVVGWPDGEGQEREYKKGEERPVVDVCVEPQRILPLQNHNHNADHVHQKRSRQPDRRLEHQGLGDSLRNGA